MTLFFSNTNQEFLAQAQRFYEPKAGGHVLFMGSVRLTNHNKEVAYLHYEAHVSLAVSLFVNLLDDAKRQFGILHGYGVHRLGRVEVGQDAVIINVCSPHRSEAFTAARFLIDGLKKDVPIWKKEVYKDGTFSWCHENC